MKGGLRLKDTLKTTEKGSPLISIVSIVFNCKDIQRTIDSVLSQSKEANIEYIIVDGHSTDGTLEIIKAYEDRIDYWISESDSGIYNAMNKGIRLATGDVVGLINAGDTYCNGVLQKISNMYKPGLHVYYGLNRYIEGGNCMKVCGNTIHSLHKEMVAHSSCFLNREIYDTMGGFEEKYKSAGDYDYFIKLYKNKEISFHFLEEALANFYMGGISSSSIGLLEKFRIQYENGYISFLNYALKSIAMKMFK